MDGKNLTTAIAFFTVAAAFLATVGVEILKGLSKAARVRIFICVSVLFGGSLLWVAIAFSGTPAPATAVKQTMIDLADNAISKGRNWLIIGAAPSGLVHATGNAQSTIENLTTVEQPEYMLSVPPTEQFKSDTKDYLRQSATNVANRLLSSDPQRAEWPALQSDAKTIFAEVMRRLPPIKTNDVYIKYRTGYEAVCGLNHHPWIDRDYAHDAAIYLMILVEQLPPDTK
jgi:hypothetical protein